MKKTPVATYADDYNNAATKLFQWQIAATAGLVAVGFLAGALGAPNLIASAIIVYLGLYITGLVKFAQAYPNLKPGFWPKFWAGFFGFSRIGWDQIGLNNLPWKVVMTWGLAAALLSPDAIQLYMTGNATAIITVLAIVGILVPIMIAVLYGLGYLARAIFGK